MQASIYVPWGTHFSTHSYYNYSFYKQYCNEHPVSVNLWENFCGAITGKWSPGCKGVYTESLLDVDKLLSKADL